MSGDPYNARVRALFADPAHAGRLDDAVSICVEEQGLRVELSAQVADGRFQALGFRACGCPHVIAAAELFCAEFEDRPVSELAGFSPHGFMQSLAVPVEKTGRILVLEDAVRALGAALREASNPG